MYARSAAMQWPFTRCLLAIQAFAKPIDPSMDPHPMAPSPCLSVRVIWAFMHIPPKALVMTATWSVKLVPMSRLLWDPSLNMMDLVLVGPWIRDIHQALSVTTLKLMIPFRITDLPKDTPLFSPSAG